MKPSATPGCDHVSIVTTMNALGLGEAGADSDRFSHASVFSGERREMARNACCAAGVSGRDGVADDAAGDDWLVVVP